MFPSLPPVVLSEKIPVLGPLKTDLQLSRPLFVQIALEFMRNIAYTGTDLLAYFNEMADWMVIQVEAMKQLSDEFELGQFGLLLCSSFAYIDNQTKLIDRYFARFQITEPVDLAFRSNGTLWLRHKLWEGYRVLPSSSEDMLLHLDMTVATTSARCPSLCI